MLQYIILILYVYYIYINKMTIKTTLQQLMGGTTPIMEGFGYDSSGKSGTVQEQIGKGLFGDGGRPSSGTAAPETPAPTPGAPSSGSNTKNIMGEIELSTTNTIVVFVIHVVIAIIITYIWGILGSNVLFLMTMSQNDKEYIFPTKRYQDPYSYKNKNSSFFSYGFPYNLLPRQCVDSQGEQNTIQQEGVDIYLTTALDNGGVGGGVSHSLYNYIFNSVYGGLGQGGRSMAQTILGLFDTTDSSRPPNKDSWDAMEVAGGRKLLIFILFPILLYFIVIGLGFWAAGAGLVFGIISQHPFWGMIFTLFFGIFIAFGNGIWMAIQSVYIFGLYPCMNIKNKTTYDKIFNNVRPYMLLIFYILIAFYAFQDLGNSGGAGVIFFIIVSYFTGNAS